MFSSMFLPQKLIIDPIPKVWAPGLEAKTKVCFYVWLFTKETLPKDQDYWVFLQNPNNLELKTW